MRKEIRLSLREARRQRGDFTRVHVCIASSADIPDVRAAKKLKNDGLLITQSAGTLYRRWFRWLVRHRLKGWVGFASASPGRSVTCHVFGGLRGRAVQSNLALDGRGRTRR
jgi:hypothetical protein